MIKKDNIFIKFQIPLNFWKLYENVMFKKYSKMVFMIIKDEKYKKKSGITRLISMQIDDLCQCVICMNYSWKWHFSIMMKTDAFS